MLITALFLILLGLGIWKTGGLAFSPGPLSQQSDSQQASGGFSSHAEFEKQCRLCHRPLETTQDALCLECHSGVAIQIETDSGVHGKTDAIHPCSGCHAEHQGREFDLLSDAINKFDHEKTNFSLAWHQIDYAGVPMSCTSCHSQGSDFSLQLENCSSCHENYDPAFMNQHILDFGSQCVACHDGQDRMAQFNHASTDFPLEGRHADLTCTTCHAREGSIHSMQDFLALPMECAGCHLEPEIHAGLFEEDCAMCHTPQDWQNVVWEGEPFEHFSSTGFSLAKHSQDYSGQPLRCTSCHPASLDQFQAQICLDCHNQENPEFMQLHLEQVGPDCVRCHDGVDRMADFDHASLFPLEGAHAAVQCQDCHSAGFEGTPSTCVSCHAEPEIHAGFFGLECQNCHTTQSWSPALLKNHPFPLDHGSDAPLACKTCHPSRFTEYTCYDCHEHQPGPIASEHLDEGISQAELPECARCHPTGLKEEGED